MAISRWQLIVGALVAGVTLSAQDAPVPRATFDAVSIKKLDGPVQALPRLISEHGRFSVGATTVANLIQFAYQVRDDLITDGPDWIRTELFEINATAGRDASADEMRPMTQSLLAARFKLVIRRESRVTPHFALRLAREDGELGAGIRKTDSCSDPGTRPTPVVPSGAARSVGCGTMADIAAATALRGLGAPVIDQTHTTGLFQFTLYASPEALAWSPPGLPPLRPVVSAGAANLPSLRDALRDQLGLDAVPVRGPLEVLVVESVERPTAN